jgi:hypothetical protein
MAFFVESTWRMLTRQTEPPLTRQMLGMPFTLNVAKLEQRTELGRRPLKGLGASSARNEACGLVVEDGSLLAAYLANDPANYVATLSLYAFLLQ